MIFVATLLYRLALNLYRTGVQVAALLGNEKARKWLSGRRHWQQSLQHALDRLPKGPRIWLHAASLGEFEQGRPVLEQLQKEAPDCQVILTFFSPSGYEQQKHFQQAAIVAYLPLDNPANARRFLEMVQPQAALFVKYEFWYFFLKTLQERRIPTLLFSAAFRQEQPFFKWYGGLFRKMLSWYDALQVQDRKSLFLLQQLSPALPVVLGGDTRYDRVAAIAARLKEIETAALFKGKSRLLVAGSTWPADEALLRYWLDQRPADWKLILAPHEIDAPHLAAIEKQFDGQTVRFSQFSPDSKQPVLIIDNIGLLSSLYRYGDVAFIGGGFARSGIHNVLEPAVYGIPVLMGPHYRKFSEAVQLVENGFAVPVENKDAFLAAFTQLAGQSAALKPEIKSFMATQTGATSLVMQWIRGKVKDLMQ